MKRTIPRLDRIVIAICIVVSAIAAATMIALWYDTRGYYPTIPSHRTAELDFDITQITRVTARRIGQGLDMRTRYQSAKSIKPGEPFDVPQDIGRKVLAQMFPARYCVELAGSNVFGLMELALHSIDHPPITLTILTGENATLEFTIEDALYTRSSLYIEDYDVLSSEAKSNESVVVFYLLCMFEGNRLKERDKEFDERVAEYLRILDVAKREKQKPPPSPSGW